MNKILNIWKIADIRNKVLVVTGLLFFFRILSSIPLPGVDLLKLKALLASNQLLGFLNVFSGGSLDNLSIVMMGVGPYITATIIMQLLTMIFPNLKKLYYEEGAIGRAKFNRISRYITVPLAALQSYGFLNLLNQQQVFTDFSFNTVITSVIVATAGSMILVWLGELISEQKIGNGTSLIIFAGICAGLPQALKQLILTYDVSLLATYIVFGIVAILVIAGVVFVTEGERKIPISYARQARDGKTGSVDTYLPLKVNQAGVIPIIFAISILLFPQFIAQITGAFNPSLGNTLNSIVNPILNNQIIYAALYFILVILFTYFYTSITFEPKEVALNLQRSSGFVPGIRPGEPTKEYLESIVSKITLFGSVFLGLIAILPLVIQYFANTNILTIGGTTLLIVVSVALDSMRQIDSQLVMREYEVV